MDTPSLETTEAAILMTAALPAVKEAASFLNGRGIATQILRPDECSGST